MGLTVVMTDDARAAGERALAPTLAAGRAAAWLLPDGSRALARRRSLASSSARFGVTCASLAAYVDDRWELFGEGLPCAAAMQRTLLMKRALDVVSERDTAALPRTPGVSALLCDAVRDGLFAGSIADAACADGLADAERSVLAAVRCYDELLAEAGLCERADAMESIVADEAAIASALVVEGFFALTVAEARFFVQAAKQSDVVFLLEVDAASRFDVAVGLCDSLEAMGGAVRRERWFASGAADCRCGASVATEREEEAASAGASLLRDAATRAAAGDGSALGLDFDACRAPELRALSAMLFCPREGEAVQPTGAVRVVLPAGRYAEARAVADALRECPSERILVACNDPIARAEALVPLLTADGYALEAHASTLFADTDFGRALLNVHAVAHGEPVDAFQASDAAFCALAGIDANGAYALDRAWRANRLLKPVDVIESLRARLSDDAASFVDAVAQGALRKACDCAEAVYATRSSLSFAERAENLAAVRLARDAFAFAHHAGMGDADVLSALSERPVASSRRWGARDAAKTVTLLPYAAAAAQPPASFDAAFACNLNASEQPLRAAVSPLDSLAEKQGRLLSCDVLHEARARFAAVARTARERLVLVRTMHDVQAEPLYPAVLFEDVVDCYRVHANDDKEMDRATGLPKTLLPYALLRGEEALSANLDAGFGVDGRTDLPLDAPDAVSDDAKPFVVLPRPGVPAATGAAVLSPSAVESYLECPRKWFSLRRLRLDGVDAAFGPQEKGTFAHNVLRRYYEEWQASHDVPKSDLNTITEADQLLFRLFDEEAAREFERDPRENPLVPLTQVERRQMEELRFALQGFLRRDAELLPGFAPRLLEHSFGADNPIDYAGVKLLGTIDRVDFDAQGRVVVIDYKSSLSDDYCLLSEAGAAFALPVKVQTLLYAQAVRRLLGVEVVGALYVHILRPGSKPAVCGAYDDRLLGERDIPGINVKRNALSHAGFASFADLLDATEDLVAQALRGLVGGDVSARPRTSAACAWCPVTRCEGRDRA